MFVPRDPTPFLTRWLLRFVVAWVLVCLAFYSHGQPRRNPRVQAATLDWLRQRLGASETWGYNRGPVVNQIIRAGGGQPGQEYCGFTQTADQRAQGLPYPAGGMQGAARAWFIPSSLRTYYLAGRRGLLDSIQPGDLVGFAWHPNPVVHHITRCEQVVAPLRKGRAPRGFYCLGGNEGHGTTAGLHRTFYYATKVSAAARWDYH